MKIIENLRYKTSTGIDGISNQLLKSAKNVFGKTFYYNNKSNDSYWYIS